MGRFIHNNDTFVDVEGAMDILNKSRRHIFNLIDRKVLRPQTIQLSHSKKLWFHIDDVNALKKGIPNKEPSHWRTLRKWHPNVVIRAPHQSE